LYPTFLPTNSPEKTNKNETSFDKEAGQAVKATIFPKRERVIQRDQTNSLRFGNISSVITISNKDRHISQL